jgi:hypothetical protein
MVLNPGPPVVNNVTFESATVFLAYTNGSFIVLPPGFCLFSGTIRKPHFEIKVESTFIMHGQDSIFGTYLWANDTLHINNNNKQVMPYLILLI